MLMFTLGVLVRCPTLHLSTNHKVSSPVESGLPVTVELTTDITKHKKGLVMILKHAKTIIFIRDIIERWRQQKAKN